jgi:hypothetical protein
MEIGQSKMPNSEVAKQVYLFSGFKYRNNTYKAVQRELAHWL